MAKPDTIHVITSDGDVRRTLALLLKSDGRRVTLWFDAVAFLKDAERAVPACIVLHWSNGGPEGLTHLGRLNMAGVRLPTIVTAEKGRVETAMTAMRAGAADFLEFPLDQIDLVRAVDRSLGLRHGIVTRQHYERDAIMALNALTPRERQILEGLACGLPNKAIAYDLNISARTVEVYRANVMVKLGVRNLAAILRFAFASGMGRKYEWIEAYGGKNPRVSKPLRNQCE